MTPRSLSRRVLVEHVNTGVRKQVLRSQLAQLSPVWRRVNTKQATRKTKTTTEPPAESPVSIEEQ